MADEIIKNAELKEGELKDVSGGFLYKLAGCFFTPKGELTVRSSVEGYADSYWMECNSICRGLVMCPCHGCTHCKDRWHRMDANGELWPREHANHDQKLKANNYNT